MFALDPGAASFQKIKTFNLPIDNRRKQAYNVITNKKGDK